MTNQFEWAAPGWWIDSLLSVGRRRESVIIAGFWRSGTTVVMERARDLTGFRTFFEPLHFSVGKARQQHPGLWIEANGRRVSQWIPYRSPTERDPALESLIRAAVAGRLSTQWTRRRRRRLGSWSRSAIVKFVRANLLGPWIQSRFGWRPIWVVRHPGAVLASITRPSGGAPGLLESLGEAALLNWVMDQERVRKDFPELADISARWARSTSRSETILRLWSVAHWIPWRMAARGRWNPAVLRFRDVVLTPTALCDKLVQVGVQPRSIDDRPLSIEDSSTTKPERRKVPPESRIASWRRELSSSQLCELDRTLHSFGDAFHSWAVGAEA